METYHKFRSASFPLPTTLVIESVVSRGTSSRTAEAAPGTRFRLSCSDPLIAGSLRYQVPYELDKVLAVGSSASKTKARLPGLSGSFIHEFYSGGVLRMPLTVRPVKTYPKGQVPESY